MLCLWRTARSQRAVLHRGARQPCSRPWSQRRGQDDAVPLHTGNAARLDGGHPRGRRRRKDARRTQACGSHRLHSAAAPNDLCLYRTGHGADGDGASPLPACGTRSAGTGRSHERLGAPRHRGTGGAELHPHIGRGAAAYAHRPRPCAAGGQSADGRTHRLAGLRQQAASA